MIGIRSAAASAVVLAATIALIAASSAAADSPSPTPNSAEASSPASNAKVNAAAPNANAVNRFGRSSFASTFGGVSLTDNGNHLVVYTTTTPNASAKAQYIKSSGLPAADVSFAASPTTAQEQDELLSRVTSDVPTLTHLGMHLTAWFLDYRTHQILVQLAGGNEAQESELTARYGKNVVAEHVSTTSVPALTDRSSDVSPWNGGDFIGGQAVHATGSARTGYVSTCTSGIPTHNAAGGQYLVTAAHCFPYGASVANYAATIPLGNSSNHIGSVTNRDGTTNGIDAELIFAPLSNYIWTGYTIGAVHATISGATGSPAGANVCQSGAFEGENCNFYVDALGCINLGYDDGGVVYQCHELHASGTNPQGLGAGDSGGPVYRYQSNGVYIVGTVSAGDGTVTRCVNWYPQQTRNCYTNLWYTDWAAIAGPWGLTVGGLG